jgi:ubiquinone/menaquinone biosynthesis C-methylase UbiE
MKLGECSCCPSDSVTSKDSLFERRHWLYAFFREHVFRDHTEEIRRAIFPSAGPRHGTRVLELGCGPGFYTCRLAGLFPQIQTIGVDQSTSLLEWARGRAAKLHLPNCFFCQGDACSLQEGLEQVDAIVVSRLFLIVRDREMVQSEIFRVLKPGGKCFLAEPTTRFRTRLPLWIMQLSSALSGERITGLNPASADVMSPGEFRRLVHSQPWQHVEMVQRNGYQYAICAKDVASPFPEPTPAQSAGELQHHAL